MNSYFLKIGARGLFVSTLQWFLNKYANTDSILKVDGVFGQRTYRAVTAFQKQEHLVADGIAGTRTWKAIANEFHSDDLAQLKGADVGHTFPTTNIFLDRPLPKHFAPVTAPSTVPPGKLFGQHGFVPAGNKSKTGKTSKGGGILEHRSIVDPRGLGKDQRGISIIGFIFFKTDESVLKSDDIAELAKLKQYLPELKKRRILFTLEGWADKRGSASHNRELSQKRAYNVDKEIRRILSPHYASSAEGRGEYPKGTGDVPVMRSVIIKAPPIKMKTKPVPNTDIYIRIFMAAVSLIAFPKSKVENSESSCILNKVLDGLHTNRNVHATLVSNNPDGPDFGFFNGEPGKGPGGNLAGFQGAMRNHLNRESLSDYEKASFWIVVANELLGSQFDPDKKSLKQIREQLSNLHLQARTGISVVTTNIGVGASGGKTGNQALKDVHNFIATKSKDRRSIYSCFR